MKQELNRRRQTLHIALVLLALLHCTPGWGAAKRGGPHHNRFEVQLGTHVMVNDTAPLSDEDPRLRFSVSGGYYMLDNLLIGTRCRFGVVDNDSGSFRLLATVTAFLPLPAAYVFAGVGLGHHWRETRGGEIELTERGFTASVDGGLRLALSDWIAPSAVVTYAASYAGHDNPRWNRALLVGLAISLTF